MNVTPGLGLNTSRTVQGASFNLHSPHTEVVILTMHFRGLTHYTGIYARNVVSNNACYLHKKVQVEESQNFVCKYCDDYI